MYNINSKSDLERIFEEIYYLIQQSKKEIIDPWIKIGEITTLNQFDGYMMDEFIYSFPFLSRERWNHIAVNKIEFILEVPQILSYDIKHLAERLLDFQGFERLIKEILSKVGYYALTNFRFTDHSEFALKTSQERYEIDIVGLKRNFFLLIDAKEWHRRSPFGGLNKAANLQYQRGIALTKNSDSFHALLESLLTSSTRLKSYVQKHFPLKLFPIMVTLENNNIRLNEKQVPLVSIHQLNSFLHELPNNLDYYRQICLTENMLNGSHKENIKETTK